MTKLNADAVIVLGGSFNPPTIAHAKLLAHALDSTGAGTGLFVPSSHAYVGRKVRKAKSPYLFTEDERLRMLQAVCSTDPRFAVSTCEYGDDGRGHTYKTMARIQARDYPGRQCCFLTGADKLHIIPRWHDAERFVDEFTFVVTSRDDADAEALIQASPLLRAHADKFVLIQELDGLTGVSSTLAQKALWANDGETLERVLDPCILRIALERNKN